MRKKIGSILILASLFFALGFFYEFHYPKLKEWAKAQVYLHSYDHLPVLVRFENLEINPFILGIELYGVEISPKDKTLDFFKKITIDSVDISMSFLALILGRFEIDEITVRKPETSLILKDKRATNIKSDYTKWLKQSLNLPLNEIHIKQATLLARIEKFQQSILIKDFNLSVENGIQNIFATIDLPNILLKEQQKKTSLTYFSLESDIVFGYDEINLDRFVMKREDSYLVAKANIAPKFTLSALKNSDLVARWKIDLSSLHTWLRRYKKDLAIPLLQGNIEGSVHVKRSEESISKIELKGSELKIADKFYIGDMDLLGRLEKNYIAIDKVVLQNKKQDVAIENTKFYFDDENTFITTASVNSIELRQLLQDLSITENLPLYLMAQGNITCKGHFKPSFLSNCDAKAQIPSFYVTNDKKEIVRLKEVKTQGEVEITDKKISITSDLTLNDSKAKASAIIEYEKGFVVDYSSEAFDLSHIDNLFNLDLKGIAKIEGSTFGNAKSAQINLSISTQDFFFEKYYLGNNKANISYKYPNLDIQSINGKIENTLYKGEVNLNIPKGTIQITGNSPLYNLSHTSKILQNYMSNKIDFRGVGNVSWNINGPLKLSELNYQASMELNRVFIEGESFDTVVANIDSNKDQIFFKETYLKKATTTAYLNGGVSRKGNLDFRFSAKDIKIQDSEFLQVILPNLDANFDLNSEIKGKVNSPVIQSNLLLDEYSIGETNYKKGQITFDINKQSFSLSAILFSEQLKMSTSKKFQENENWLLDMKFEKWNFSPLFNLISKNNEREGFDTLASGSVSLEINETSPLRSSLNANIKNFKISSGAFYLQNEETIQLAFNNKQLVAENTRLRGNDNYFLKLEAVSKTQANIAGKVNLALISFLTPFIRDLRGDMDLNSSVELKKDGLKVIGSAKLSQGYASLEDFPMALRDINSDFTFSQNYLQINRFTANFGDGSLRGNGTARFIDYGNLPLKFEAVIDSANLKLNETSTLLSSGNLTLEGSWFPYLLKGQMQVREGVISQEKRRQQRKVEKSEFLPTAITKKEFTPLEADLKIDFIGNQIKIIDPLIQTSIQGGLKVTGDISQPHISGELKQAEKGTMQFNEVEFTIDTMNINFQNTRKINPNIFLSATTRWKDYDIDLTATGTLNDPNINFTSQPPLNEGDIITLLTLGYTQQSLSEEQDIERENSRSLEIASAILNRNPLNKELKEQTGITFKFNTATDAANEDITVPKIEISKQWGDRLVTKAGRTFGEVLKNDAKIEYKLNKKVSVIGSWTGETATENAETIETLNEDVFGLDLEYKIEFK